MSSATMVVLASRCPLGPLHRAHLGRSGRSVVFPSCRFHPAQSPRISRTMLINQYAKTIAKHTQSGVTGSVPVPLLWAPTKKSSSSPIQGSAAHVRLKPPSLRTEPSWHGRCGGRRPSALLSRSFTRGSSEVACGARLRHHESHTSNYREFV